MYSRGHAILSGAIGIPLALWSNAGAPAWLLWGSVVLVGVGIDVDHFLIGRLNRGDWTNLRRCLRRPTRAFLAQSDIFDRGDVHRDQRLLSHLLLGGVLTTAASLLATQWAVAAAVTVYVHVLADLYADIRTRADSLEAGP